MTALHRTLALHALWSDALIRRDEPLAAVLRVALDLAGRAMNAGEMLVYEAHAEAMLARLKSAVDVACDRVMATSAEDTGN